MKETLIKYSGKSKEGEEFSGEVTANLPENLDEAKQVYGEEVSLSKITQAVTIDIQRICRVHGDDEAKAQETVNSFVPGVTRARTVSGVSMKTLKEKLRGLDADTLAALIAEVEAKAAGAESLGVNSVAEEVRSQ